MNEDSTDEELIRIAFRCVRASRMMEQRHICLFLHRVLDKKGSGRIKRKEFKNLMMNIGDKLTEHEVSKVKVGERALPHDVCVVAV